MMTVSSRLPWAALCLLTACGSRAHPECRDGTHEADPDGHGSRCIDDASTCESALDCETDDPCCEPACADSGDGVYACSEQCRTPGCTADSCEAGWRCERSDDECDGWCAPDEVQCPAGRVAADPHGTGTFECVRADSACFSDVECPPSADGCCPGLCRDQGDGLLACGTACAAEQSESEGDGESGKGADMEWECGTDQECETMMGQPGWTCVLVSCDWHECVPPPGECQSADDCVIATDLTQCCGCADGYPRSEVAADPCLQASDGSDAQPAPPDEEADPPVCALCPDVECPIDCAFPSGVDCTMGTCVARW